MLQTTFAYIDSCGVWEYRFSMNAEENEKPRRGRPPKEPQVRAVVPFPYSAQVTAIRMLQNLFTAASKREADEAFGIWTELKAVCESHFK